MGLSRNKVAVSEGAAGSPPFYGDQETESAGRSRDLVVELGKNLDREMCIRVVQMNSVVQLSGFNRSLREQTQKGRTSERSETSSLFTLHSSLFSGV